MEYFYHESLHRSEQGMARLAQAKIVVCGAGSLGANVTENLARAGVRNLTIIDMDTIEERNLSTQPYQKNDVGSKKARVLANNLYRACGTKLAFHTVKLDDRNAKKLLRDADLVIDTFDNSESRATVQSICQELKVACLHAGMASRYSEVVWDPGYRVPSPANDDVCDYPLARNLAMITSAIAAEASIRFIDEGSKDGFAFTFGDMKVSKQ